MLNIFWRYAPRLWLVVTLLLVAASSRAQTADEPPEYRATIREALSEYHAKNFPEARALFAEAHRMLPNARTLRGLGMTAFELRSYRESIGFLQEALASQVKPLEGSLRADTERLLKRAERFVGRLRVSLTPSDARILVDGSPVDVRDGEPILLEIGSHNVEFQAEGHAPETRTIEIKGRESDNWTVALTPLPPPAPVATPREVAEQAPESTGSAPELAPPSEREHRPLRKNPWLWTGVGAAVLAGVVTGIALAVRDPGLKPIDTDPNTPTDGVFRGLGVSP